MRHARHVPSEFDHSGGFGLMMFRNLSSVSGLLIILVVALMALALATWNVADPSISHATRVVPTNFLGHGGAIVADLMMQVLGLAAPLLLLPPLVFGWRLAVRGVSGFGRSRVIPWIGAALLGAVALSSLPVPAGWPLPLGLGGIAGDLILKPLGSVIGDAARLVAGLVGGFGALMLLLTTLTPAAPRPVRAPVSRHDRGRRRDDDEEEGGGASLAILHHWWLVLRANLRRLSGRRPGFRAHEHLRAAGSRRAPAQVDDRFGDYDDFDDDLAPRPVTLRGRREPSLAPVRPRPPQPPEPQFEAEDEVDVEDDADPQPYFDYDAAQEADWSEDEAEAEAIDESEAEEEVIEDEEDEAPPVRPSARVAEPTASGRRVSVTAAAKPLEQARRNAPKKSRVTEDEERGYEFPPLGLLAEPKRLGPNAELSEEVLEGNAGMLEGVLDDFGIKGEIIHVRPGPVVTLYELRPAPGVKSSRVIGLSDDIARSMSAVSARVAVVPGHNVIGIELPNQRRETVYFREMIASPDFQHTKHRLAVCLGKTIGGEPVIVDLARMPHLLVAGTTGSGKSVAINTMIMSLLFRLTPEECKLIMIDPKMLELSVYDGIPHLLTPVVTDPKKAVVALKWTVKEMEDRYRKMSKLGVRNIDGYNARIAEAKARGEVLTREVQTGFHRQTGEPIYEMEELALDNLPYIVVIVDEMADLMMVAGKEIEGAIQRLAQMARAAGIHIVMATQRPSVDVVTGTIKANFPTRISFQVTSKIDSRTILGEQGAEQLLGQGDMLYMAGGGKIQRVHGPFVTDGEVEKIVHHLKRQGSPQYLEAITAAGEEEDADAADAGGVEESGDLYDKAVSVVMRDKKVSTSYIQRRLGIGYNKAASLIERMEREGVISAPNSTGKREILLDLER